MTSTDATRLAGDAYSTRMAREVAANPDDKTRLVDQAGYQSKLARDSTNGHFDANEFYKVGEKIGDRYEVAAIHHGAMGVVYGCFDHETKLPRALKTVRARYANDKQVLSLFESEAFVWVSLEKHPNIVRAYRVERFNNLPFVITEYVCGPAGMEGDLRGWLGHPRLTLPVTVAMALQIAQGMQHAVRKMPGLVHRDLKPANILVNSEATAMVTDFGLVLAGQSGAGTPAYMSPEQWRGEDLDLRSDIYAYGCILFEMFTAHRLFAAVSEKEWEIAHLEKMPAVFASSDKKIPLEIKHFLYRCLEKSRAARPQGWDEVVDFFAEWYHQLTGKAVVFDFSTLALDSSELVVAGYSLQNINFHEQAIQAYERALAIDPNNCLAWVNTGYALGKLNHHGEAIQAYERALALDPNNCLAWFHKGHALGKLNRHGEAIQAYDRTLAVDPNYPFGWYFKGNALVDLNRHEEAIAAYSNALVIDPNDRAAWSRKGDSLRELRRYEEAIKTYDRAITIDQNYYFAWSKKGDALRALKRYEEAINAYDRAIAINQDYYFAWLNKGDSLRELRRYEEAIKTYDRAITIDQNYYSAWSKKGDALRALKRYEEAIKAYDRAIAINQNNYFAWLNKGDSLRELRRYEEAITAYDRAITIDRCYYFAWSKKGDALLNLRRCEEANQAYDCALAIDPNMSVAWNNKGIALGELNRHEDAIQAYDRALAIDTSISVVWMNKGFVLSDLNRHAEASQAYSRAVTSQANIDHRSQGFVDRILWRGQQAERARSRG